MRGERDVSAQSFEGVVALLHVSALVGALWLAYMKIDKLSDGRREPFERSLEEIKQIAATIVLENGLNGLGITWSDIGQIRIIFPACVICLIADQPRPIGRIMGFAHFIYRQFHIPFFMYFRHRWHLVVGGLMTGASLLIFFACAAAIIWDVNWVFNKLIIRCSFIALVAFMIWLVFTNSLTTSVLRLSRLKEKCETLKRCVESRRRAREHRLWKMLEEFEPPRRM